MHSDCLECNNNKFLMTFFPFPSPNSSNFSVQNIVLITLFVILHHLTLSHIKKPNYDQINFKLSIFGFFNLFNLCNLSSSQPYTTIMVVINCNTNIKY